MFIAVLSLIIVAAVLLVLVILAQNSKGGGLSSQFGGSGASNMIGVKKTGDLLERLTWGLIVAIFVLTVSTNFMVGGAQAQTDEIQERANEQAVPNNIDLGGLNSAPADSSAPSLDDVSGQPEDQN